MYDLAILVVLYNCKPSNSVTVKSFIENSSSNKNVKLVIWNNGPNEIKEDLLINNVAEIGYRETLHNESLAKIYNNFIATEDARAYVILDHDTTVTPEYLSDTESVEVDGCAFPIISCGESITGPLVNNVVVQKPCKLKSSDSILAIGSGLVIGRDCAKKIKDIYGDIFDERFYLYGIDSTFCYRLKSAGLMESCFVLPTLKHSLSRLEKESSAIIEFRKKERSYSFGLTLRHYKKASYLRVFCILLLKRLVNRSPLSIKFILHALSTGKHHRDNK